MSKNINAKKGKASPERYDLIGSPEAASVTEQTGLIAAAPINDYEYESYSEILPFAPKQAKLNAT